MGQFLHKTFVLTKNWKLKALWQVEMWSIAKNNLNVVNWNQICPLHCPSTSTSLQTLLFFDRCFSLHFCIVEDLHKKKGKSDKWFPITGKWWNKCTQHAFRFFKKENVNRHNFWNIFIITISIISLKDKLLNTSLNIFPFRCKCLTVLSVLKSIDIITKSKQTRKDPHPIIQFVFKLDLQKFMKSNEKLFLK